MWRNWVAIFVLMSMPIIYFAPLFRRDFICLVVYKTFLLYFFKPLIRGNVIRWEKKKESQKHGI